MCICKFSRNEVNNNAIYFDERKYSSLMLTPTMDPLFKLIIKNSIRPLRYNCFSWLIITLPMFLSGSWWKLLNKTCKHITVFLLPFHLMAFLMPVQRFLQRKSEQVMVFQAETGFTFISFIGKVCCRKVA